MIISFTKSTIKTNKIDLHIINNTTTHSIKGISKIKYYGKVYVWLGLGSKIHGTTGQTCYVSRKSFRNHFVTHYSLQSKLHIPKNINMISMQKIFDSFKNSASVTEEHPKEISKLLSKSASTSKPEPEPKVKPVKNKEPIVEDPVIVFAELRKSDRWNVVHSDGALMFNDEALRFIIENCTKEVRDSAEVIHLGLLYDFARDMIKGKSAEQLKALCEGNLVPQLVAEISSDGLAAKRKQMLKNLETSVLSPEKKEEAIAFEMNMFIPMKISEIQHRIQLNAR